MCKECGCESGSCDSGESNFIDHIKIECDDAIHQAHRDALKDRMRKKIEAKYGTTLDKLADATFEEFEKAWKSMTIKAKDKSELDTTLEKIFSQKSD